MFDGIAGDPAAGGVHPYFVGTAEFPRLAERVRPHIERMAAGSGGRYWPQDLMAGLFAGGFHLWLAFDGAEIGCALLTEFIPYPRCRALRIVGLVGHRPGRWMHLLHAVEYAARVNFGCAKIECLHQPGHERMLRTGGWRTFHLLSEKDLV